jgi:hypothetical protein
MNFDANNPVPGENDTLLPEGFEDKNTEQVPAPSLKGRIQKVDEPKIKQFTGRATENEYTRISTAIKAQGTGDIVRFALACINHIEADVFQTFKTK